VLGDIKPVEKVKHYYEKPPTSLGTVRSAGSSCAMRPKGRPA